MYELNVSTTAATKPVTTLLYNRSVKDVLKMISHAIVIVLDVAVKSQLILGGTVDLERSVCPNRYMEDSLMEYGG